jgi:hypothetical protein
LAPSPNRFIGIIVDKISTYYKRFETIGADPQTGCCMGRIVGQLRDGWRL